MRFAVKAKDPSGAVRTFSREAETRDALVASLRAERLLVLSVEEIAVAERELPPCWSPAWLRPMTTFDVELALRQLASMLRSGVTLLESVRTVADQALTPWATLTWRRVAERIFQGRGFSQSLAEQPRRFDEGVVRLCAVGETSGELEHAVTRAADQLESRRNLKSAVVNALIYPAVAVVMAIGVSVYLVVAVIPKVAGFLQAGGAELPSLTRMLMDFAAWVNRDGVFVLVALAAAAAVWLVVRFNPAGRELEDVFLLRLPVTGRILRLSGTSLFARSMQIMTESGVTLLDALETSAGLMANRRLRRRVAEAHDAVLEGRSLADGLAGAVEFMPMLPKMAAVGEVTGALPEAFGEAARFHEMLLALAVKRFGMLIEPVMIIVTAAIVGFVYIAFFMAIFAMAGTS